MQSLNINSNLGPGSTGSDVLALQNWLIGQGYLTQSQVATGPGTYGPQTTAAVTAWQNANHIDTQGNPGYFGPISRTFVQNQGNTQPTTTQTSGTSATQTGQTAMQTTNNQGGQTNTGTSSNNVNLSSLSQIDQNWLGGIDQDLKVNGASDIVPFLTRSVSSLQSGRLSPQAFQAAMQQYNVTPDQFSSNPDLAKALTAVGINIPTSTQTQSSASGTNTNGTSGITINGQTFDTGNADTNAALQAIYDAGKTTVSQGYQLNPNLTLDQGTVDQFLTAATNSVHPYYAQQIAGIQDQLNRDVGQTTSQYQNTQADEQQQYKSGLASAREQYAGNGLAFSGQRGLGETNMQNSENRMLSQNALNYGNQVGDLARTAEKQIGTSNMSGFQLPSSPTYSASLAGNSGGFDTTGTTTPSYTPGGFNVGSLTSQEQSDITNRQDSLINSAYGRQAAGLSYQDLLA